jgi:YVTN family beta-propeller protein
MPPSFLSRRGALALAAGAALVLDGCAGPAPAVGALGDGAHIERFVIGGAGGWDFLTFDPVGRRLFITRGDRVQVWSAQTQRLVAEIAETSGVHGVALAPDLNRGFTTNGRANTVGVFALDDLRMTNTIEVQGQNPDAILYDPRLKRIYAFNGRSASMTVIDAIGLTVIATVPLGGKPEVAVTDGQGHVFVNIEDTAELVVIEQASDRVQARWPLHPCQEPTGLAIDVAHARLLSVCANHMMVIVDASSGRLVAAVPIGAEPDGVEFDPASGRAFSANGEGTVTVVQETDPEHFTAVATIATQPRARTLALDPRSHRIYLVSAAFGPPTAATSQQPQPRAPMVPDTFSVIVLAPK